jgi:hypothetical protein
MPQRPATLIENSFVNGLVTEATGLNFPDKAVTETYDCEFDLDGSVYRRTALDLEEDYTTKTIDRTASAIKTYLWQNVAGNGDVTVAVVQVGNKLYFYETNGTGIFSTGEQTTTVTLTPVSGAPTTNAVEAQFTDGNGVLIVTHPYCEPMSVVYDIAAHTATATNIIIKIRDFEGAVADPYTVEERPTSTLAALNASHKYNLYNQGWNTTNLTAWDTAFTTMPSNADIMWRFKNTADNFEASAETVARITSGNTPAPKGHFVLTLSNQDRSTASGVASVASTTTSFQRPSTCNFFAGRVFYSGINYIGFNSNIYFTQIIERSEQYGSCYQVNDPASEELFDLLPSDGGVISIPEAGTIIKMFTVPGGLCVFAANGVWFITGSTGLGFTANDYAPIKIADINTLSDTSFVNVNGYPAWWNSEGIYIMQGGQNLPAVKALSYDTIKTFYDQIPVASKRYARGFFDRTDGHIRWLYRSENTSTLEKIYEYDRVLNFNIRTNAFYPWTISPSDVKVHAILSSELVTRPIDVNLVSENDLVDLIVDSGGNQVITYSTSGNTDQQFDKYLVSYPDSGSYEFTFANRTDDTYKDWESYDNFGVNYNSYLKSGFRLSGQALTKFQTNYINIYSRTEVPVTYNFQGLWDFANTGNTGRWSASQQINHTDTDYNSTSRRLKVRGHGKALQFKLSSVADQPFDIIGWSSLQTINAAP